MNRITQVFGWMGVLLAVSAAPAGAEPMRPMGGLQMHQCSELSNDLGTTRNYALLVDQKATTLATDLNTLANDVNLPIDVQQDVQRIKGKVTQAQNLLNDLATLGSLVPEIGDPLKVVATTVGDLNSDVLDPLNNRVTKITNELRLQQVHNTLQNAARNVKTKVQKPLDTSASDLQQALRTTDQSVTDMDRMDRMLSSSCQAKVAQEMEHACAKTDGPVGQVDREISDVATKVKQLEDAVQLAMPYFNPFSEVRRELAALERSLDQIIDKLKGLGSLLDYKIKLGILGKFSINDILRDWKELEKWLKLDWLEKEIFKVFKPEIDALKGLLHLPSVNIHFGFDINVVSNLLQTIEDDANALEADIRTDITRLTDDIKNALTLQCK